MFAGVEAGSSGGFAPAETEYASDAGVLAVAACKCSCEYMYLQ